MIYIDMHKNYLAHHGIKGQRWGVRRNRKKALSTTDPRVLSKYSSYLTDQELNDRINRIQIEQRARALLPQKKKKERKKMTLVGVLAQAGAAAGSLNKIAQAWNGDLGTLIRKFRKGGGVSDATSGHVSTDDIVSKCMEVIGPKLKQCWVMTMSELQRQNAARYQQNQSNNVVYQPSRTSPQIQPHSIVPYAPRR